MIADQYISLLKQFGTELERLRIFKGSSVTGSQGIFYMEDHFNGLKERISQTYTLLTQEEEDLYLSLAQAFVTLENDWKEAKRNFMHQTREQRASLEARAA